MSFAESELKKLQDEGLYRRLSLPGAGVDFSSNDYLGLSRSPQVRNAVLAALQDGLPLGATGSRLLRGHWDVHARVENFLADHYRVSSALLFASGYSANVAVLSALGDETSEIFSDALNHASLIDGIRLSHAKRQVFAHNDVEDLYRRLSVSRSRRKIIVTESLFSMDGDLAPLKELLALARECDAVLVVDEAHATGVMGHDGLGRLEDLDVGGVELVAIHTCGKALGAQGAFVLSSRALREFFINRSRPFVFSTALSPILAVQIEAAVKVAHEMSEARRQLQTRAENFRTGLRAFCDIGESESHIAPVILRSNEKALGAAARLQDRGWDVRAVRAPTVAVGTERLRLSLKSFHTEAELKTFLKDLKEELAR